ncbi:ATP-dependent Clp protease ATP-binding subunit [Mucilaginibacter galii]|uniref:ATPase AAA n=1 Tax=Mucilaginibacter galii TaxID=2005073 RepID=A0A917J7G9_9SPHI|nr:ATP-dependent Clp protease ATP-binding subunit [Mucilaginibacter galii]GGI49876.1 ATPase AAA [Mucilaginibacter galii]
MSVISLSESVKTGVRVAQSLAKEYHHKEFGPAHLLKGLMHQEVGLRNFLTSIDKDAAYISDWADVRMEEYPQSITVPDEMLGNDAVKVVFDEADNVRVKLGLDAITPICILIALTKPNVGFDAGQLKSFPLKEKELLDVYIQDEGVQNAIASPSADGSGAASSGGKSTGALFKYCVDRTDLARQGKIDPIIGRDKETRMVMEILSRRTKPNVIITGDAGVGKTALVDGFALDIVNNQVPQSLLNVSLFELDLGSLIAGASYKGEIEDRLKNILKEIKQFDKAILFIDEIHTLLDNKGPIGGGVGNLLKPELARGEITVIGATTIDEYRKIIEPEQAFSRRFEVLQVNEPDIDTAIKMLEKLVPYYEEHHGLKISNDAVQDCVRLAKRYMKDRRLPDSAFDLMDRTMAAIRLMNDTSDMTLAELKEKFNTLKDAEEDTSTSEYKWLYSLMQNKTSAVLLGKLEDETQVSAFETADEYIEYFNRNLPLLEELAQSKTSEVEKQDIAAIISYKTGIPLGKIQAQEKERLLNMEGFLKKRVVGQDQALKAVADAILESRSGLNKKGQPIGSFFLLGPTGTGKTELAKSIADFLFNDEKAMIRFDMSEFKEEHSAALLYGAPPGYVGYEEGGLLVNKIRQQPYSVLLFDEIEKAHPSVFDIFLQILDEGHMHDRLGKEGDFSNSLILFTSNIGSEWIAEQLTQGHLPTSNQLMEVMAGKFRPEFLARISEIVPFKPIAEENVVKIFEIQLKSLIESLDKMGIGFSISDEAKSMLALGGFTPKYGARQLSGVIRNQLRRPISKYIISGELKKGHAISVDKQPESEELIWAIN